MLQSVRRPVLVGLLAILGVGAVLFIGHRIIHLKQGKKVSLNQRLTAVTVAPAKSRAIQQVVRLTGTIVAKNNITLQPSISGHLVQMDAHVGEHVTAGQALFSLGDATLLAQLHQAQANLAQANDHYLAAKQGGSTTVVSEAQAGVQMAKAKLSQLESGASQAQINVAKTNVQNAQTAYQDAQNALVQNTSNQSQASVSLQNAEAALSNITNPTVSTAQTAVNNATTALNNVQSQSMNNPLYVAYLNAENNLQSFQSSLTNVTNSVYYKEALSQEQQAYAAWQSGINSAQLNLNTANAALGQATNQVQNQASVAQAQNGSAMLSAKSVFDQAQAALNTAKANLASLLAPPSSQAIAEAKAAVSQAEAQLENAIQPNTPTQLSALSASAAAAQAAVDLAQAQLNRAKMVAPTNGVITARKASVGDLVGPSTVIYTMEGKTKEVQITLPEKQLGAIRTGDRVQFTVPGSRVQYKGTVHTIYPTASTSSLSFEVVIMPDHMQGLHAGEAVEVAIATKTSQASLSVPTNAVLSKASGKTAVFVVNHGVAKQIYVKVGASANGYTEILSGLKKGATVVTTGKAYLATGDKVKEVKTAP